MEKVVVVMPAYKEKENMGEMIEELAGKEFPKITGADMHLLIVNDLPDDGGPDDGTGDVVRKKMKKYKNVHIIEDKKKGLGWAYVRGFKYAMKTLKADAVIEMDADFQHPPRFVKPMVQAYLDGAEYVIGSRYVKGGSIPKEWAFFRKFVSFFGNLFIRIVLIKPKIHDLTTGFRLTKIKGVMDKIELEKLMALERFSHKVDLMYQTLKLTKKVAEVPLEFASRTKEVSKFITKETISTFKVAIILGVKDKARFFKFAIVGFVGYLVNAISLEIFSNVEFTRSIASNFKGLKDTTFAFISERAAWSAALAAEMAIINNFVFNNIWTFKEKKITKPLLLVRKFLEFNLTSVGAILIQFVVIGLMVSFWQDTRLVRQLGILVAMPLVLAFNYTMYNLFIWKTWKLPWKKKKK